MRPNQLTFWMLSIHDLSSEETFLRFHSPSPFTESQELLNPAAVEITKMPATSRTGQKFPLEGNNLFSMSSVLDPTAI